MWLFCFPHLGLTQIFTPLNLPQLLSMNYAQQQRQRQLTTTAITTFLTINTLAKIQDGKVSAQNPSSLTFIYLEPLLTTFLFFSFSISRGKPRGLNAARKLRTHRRDNRWADQSFKKRLLGTAFKSSPFGGSSHAKGIVLEKVGVEAKQPNSAIRKCVRVQLIKNSKKVTAFGTSQLLDLVWMQGPEGWMNGA